MKRRESTMMVVAIKVSTGSSSEDAALIPIKVMDLCVVHTC